MLCWDKTKLVIVKILCRLERTQLRLIEFALNPFFCQKACARFYQCASTYDLICIKFLSMLLLKTDVFDRYLIISFRSPSRKIYFSKLVGYKRRKPSGSSFFTRIGFSMIFEKRSVIIYDTQKYLDFHKPRFRSCLKILLVITVSQIWFKIL